MMTVINTFAGAVKSLKISLPETSTDYSIISIFARKEIKIHKKKNCLAIKNLEEYDGIVVLFHKL